MSQNQPQQQLRMVWPAQLLDLPPVGKTQIYFYQSMLDETLVEE